MKLKLELQASTKRKLNIVGMILVVLVIAGTLAWQSFSQMALNEESHIFYSPGGRLHDDFNGENKDVYIENYAQYGTGELVFARIQLSEYLEYGEGAGLTAEEKLAIYEKEEDVPELKILRGDKQNQEDTPEFEDETTWDTYLYGSIPEEDKDTIRTYRDLNFGGTTIYMPTFNKDINNIDADINGTYAEASEILAGREHYDDYQKRFLGETLTESARLAYRDLGGPLESPIEGIDFYYNEETHQTERTLTSKVMSIQEWKDAGEPIGAYWVYDADGWAYWADAIKPQTATGLLLDKISITQETKGDWFYGVHVIAQIATAGDWGEGTVASEGVASSGIGMYAGGLTEDGLYLLNKVAKIN